MLTLAFQRMRRPDVNTVPVGNIAHNIPIRVFNAQNLNMFQHILKVTFKWNKWDVFLKPSFVANLRFTRCILSFRTRLRLPSHGGITSMPIPSVEEIPLLNSNRPSYGGITISLHLEQRKFSLYNGYYVKFFTSVNTRFQFQSNF